jgi:hypothetical protein
MIGKRLLDLGFKDPTTIQREAIPPAVQSRMDIIGAAETVSIFPGCIDCTSAVGMVQYTAVRSKCQSRITK